MSDTLNPCPLLWRLRECLPTVKDGPDAKVWCCVRGDDLRMAVDEIESLRARAEAAEREAEGLRADAARYRWLREDSVQVDSVFFSGSLEVLDAAIDAARGKK